MTAYLDRRRLGVEAKADRDDVRRAVGADRCKPAKPLPAQILDLLLGERTHHDLLCRAVRATALATGDGSTQPKIIKR